MPAFGKPREHRDTASPNPGFSLDVITSAPSMDTYSAWSPLTRVVQFQTSVEKTRGQRFPTRPRIVEKAADNLFQDKDTGPGT